MKIASSAFAVAPEGPLIFGIPVDFVLFGLTLLGVALFHQHTLRVALAGSVTIAIYKIVFTGFKTGPGVMGFVSHVGHEWVILANLVCLLMGFALLSRHFEKSHVPVALSKYLPHDWKGGFVLLVMVWILSSFLDNIAGALIGGAMAHQLFRAKVHIGYLAAIVAASNAGGAWSVLGDTTTTMMWIAGISPARVFKAIIASTVALFIFGIPAAIQQHKHSPILRGAHTHTHVDWMRVGIVGLILVLAIGTNVTVNMKFTEQADHFPFIGMAVLVAILLSIPVRRPDWEVLPEAFKGAIFLLIAGVMCFDDARGEVTAAILGNGVWSGFSLRRVRQHSAYGVGAEAGRLRLGLSCLFRRFWRLHDLVWIIVGGGAIQYVSRSKIRRAMVASRLVYPGSVRNWLLRYARCAEMASRCAALARRRTSAGDCTSAHRQLQVS